jgi:hypothetical protein
MSRQSADLVLDNKSLKPKKRTAELAVRFFGISSHAEAWSFEALMLC